MAIKVEADIPSPRSKWICCLEAFPWTQDSTAPGIYQCLWENQTPINLTQVSGPFGSTPEETIETFWSMDQVLSPDPAGYLMIEFPGGILQRETQILLGNEKIRSHIHKLVLCSLEPFGFYGAKIYLRSQFRLQNLILSGPGATSPECRQETERLLGPQRWIDPRDLGSMKKYLI